MQEQLYNCLRVDGGAARNDLLLQFQADLSGDLLLRPCNRDHRAGCSPVSGSGRRSL